jgi:hypothetical protein
MPRERLGLALRPTVFSSGEVLELVQSLERRSDVLSNIFIPDIPGSLDPIELSALILAKTQRLESGPGVIRLLEHDENLLARRIMTIQSASENRFVLGVGAGTPGPDPSQTIQRIITYLVNLRSRGTELSAPNLHQPKIYIATLNRLITRRTIGFAEGLATANEKRVLIYTFIIQHVGTQLQPEGSGEDTWRDHTHDTGLGQEWKDQVPQAPDGQEKNTGIGGQAHPGHG